MLDAPANEYLQRIVAAARTMGQLIDDMLKLSRLTRQTMTVQAVDLGVMAKGIVSELRRQSPERSVHVMIEDDLVAEGDPRLLLAVLQNLLGNSWKYTSKLPEAHIHFGARRQETETIFYVRDDGAGFDMQYADKLFGAFQRLHSVDEFEGTGIGLATVQRIVHRHGGRVWAEACVDRGATFYFTLTPAPPEGVTDDAKDHSSGRGQSGRRGADLARVAAEQHHQ